MFLPPSSYSCTRNLYTRTISTQTYFAVRRCKLRRQQPVLPRRQIKPSPVDRVRLHAGAPRVVVVVLPLVASPLPCVPHGGGAARNAVLTVAAGNRAGLVMLPPNMLVHVLPPPRSRRLRVRLVRLERRRADPLLLLLCRRQLRRVVVVAVWARVEMPLCHIEGSLPGVAAFLARVASTRADP